MALGAGTRLGPYEIGSLLGVGGMGEVYRARDTKLDRDVAIKVLPESLAADPERVARFEREAKTLARPLLNREFDSQPNEHVEDVPLSVVHVRGEQEGEHGGEQGHARGVPPSFA